MSLIRISAELIRRAVEDDDFAQDLRDAVDADERVRTALVSVQIDRDDLAWLAPSEWQWFAHWRQGMGGPLDKTLLQHLKNAAVTRYSRFDLRGLVMRNQRTNEFAPEARPHMMQDDPGLNWLAVEARQFPDSIEVAQDALQYATAASWFTLRVLTSIDDARGQAVRTELRAFVAQRQLDEEVMHDWGI